MVRRMRGAGLLLTAMLVGVAVHDAGAQCVGCAAGCVSSCPGLANCSATGSIVGPVCVTWGLCACESDAEGANGDFNPRRPRSSAATSDRNLTIYHLVWEVRGAARAPLDGAIVVRGLGAVPSPEEVEAAVSDALRVGAGRLRLADGGVFIGARSIEGAFATRDGDGFALDARRDGTAIDIATCRVTNRLVAGPIARESLHLTEALVIPVVLNGRPHLMALVPSGVLRPTGFGSHDPRSEHARFTVATRARLGRLAAQGLGLEVIEGALPCR